MLKWIFVCIAIFMSPLGMAQSLEEQKALFSAVEQKTVTQPMPFKDQVETLRRAYVDLGFNDFADRKESISYDDLDRLFSVQGTLLFYTHDVSQLPPLEYSFAELVKRDKVERKHVRKLFEQYINTRQFAGAATLEKKFPTFSLETLPNVVNDDGLDKNIRAIWLIDKTEKRLTRKPIRFSSDWQLVAISHPLCHFSKNALTYIKNDKALAKLLEGHLTLIGPQDGNLQFDIMQKWNAENPSMPIHPVDQQIAFTEFDQWSTPTFYFMKAGKVVYKFNGWPKEGNRSQLDEGLRQVGAKSSEMLPKK